MKTARFTAVVNAAGAPEVHPLWLAPDKDLGLKRAVRDCRVMTIHQALRGTKADYGTVGLHLEGSTQVLVFPKSLRRFGDRHIVGIDYRLIRQPDAPDPVSRDELRPVKKTIAPPPLPKAQTEPVPPRHPVKPRSRRERHPESAGAKALTREELLAQIHHALRELKAGKAVAAYERLNALQ